MPIQTCSCFEIWMLIDADWCSNQVQPKFLLSERFFCRRNFCEKCFWKCFVGILLEGYVFLRWNPFFSSWEWREKLHSCQYLLISLVTGYVSLFVIIIISSEKVHINLCQNFLQNKDASHLLKTKEELNFIFFMHGPELIFGATAATGGRVKFLNNCVNLSENNANCFTISPSKR